MILLLFFVLLIQFFIFWIFEPLGSFLEYVLEIRLFPIIALVGLILLFCVLLIQFSTYWIFEPFASFLEYVLEIRLFPIIALMSLFFLFSAKNIDQN